MTRKERLMALALEERARIARLLREHGLKRLAARVANTEFAWDEHRTHAGHAWHNMSPAVAVMRGAAEDPSYSPEGLANLRERMRSFEDPPDRPVVTLSWAIFALHRNEHGLVPTVAHELAHIARLRNGHDKRWRRLDVFFGGTGKRLHTLAVGPRLPSTRVMSRMTPQGRLWARRQLLLAIHVLERMIEGETVDESAT